MISKARQQYNIQMKYTANTIDEVLEIMDHFIHHCLNENNRLGYFTSLYRIVTRIVKERCDEGFFEDNDRMRLLDVVFANRYFDALAAFHNHTGEPTQSWAACFEATQTAQLLILQHLLLGMNAHISLDLGIATAEVANGTLTSSLERDFNRLNNILASLIDSVQDELSEVSPLMRYLDRLAWRSDETFASFSINIARDRAWHFAQQLAPLSPEERNLLIAERDAKVADFSRRVIGNVRWPFNLVLWLVNLRESKDTRHIVEALSNETWLAQAQSRVNQMIETAEMQGIDLAQWQSSREQMLHVVETQAIPTADDHL